MLRSARKDLITTHKVPLCPNSTTHTRPDQTHGPLGSPTSPRTLSGCRLVRSISTCTDFVRGSGLVGSGRRQSPWVRVVEFRNDTTRPDQRQSLVGPVPNSTTRTRSGPDPTRQSPQTCRRPGSPTVWSACLVEFGHY